MRDFINTPHINITWYIIEEVMMKEEAGEVVGVEAGMKGNISLSLRHGSALVYRDGMGVLASLTYI